MQYWFYRYDRYKGEQSNRGLCQCWTASEAKLTGPVSEAAKVKPKLQ